MNFNTVELKHERKGLVSTRNTLAEILMTREMSPDEQDQWSQVCEQINSLTQRIDALEMVERDATEDDEKPEDEKKDDEGDEMETKSRQKVRHLALQCVFEQDP